MVRKSVSEAVEIVSKLSSRWAVVPSEPLDYSFKDLGSIEEITTEESRPALVKQPPATQKTIVTAIRLPNNRIKSIENLHWVASKVVPDPANIGWIDLSFNDIETIHEDILKFPNLNTLYLHGNHISSLAEIDKLANLGLRTLTLHGNPIENIKGYRQCVISRMPKLKHLDFCAITKQDRPRKKKEAPRTARKKAEE